MTSIKPIFALRNCDVYVLQKYHTHALHVYINRNREFLQSFEPLRHEAYYQLETVQQGIASYLQEYDDKKIISFVLCPKAQPQTIIARINFSQIFYGVFCACYLGYSCDKDYQGQGIMSQALPVIINYMRTDYKLHRIMAHYMPRNIRSGKLLKKLGFEREGYAKSYLKINNQWEDHILNALVFDDQ